MQNPKYFEKNLKEINSKPFLIAKNKRNINDGKIKALVSVNFTCKNNDRTYPTFKIINFESEAG